MDCISASTSAKRGPMLRNSRLPAPVGNTRRVVARQKPDTGLWATHRPTERRLRRAKLRRCTAEDDQGLVLRDREVGRFHSDLRM
jgi:hypothetical protein